MGELHFYSGGTAGNRDGTLISENDSNSSPFNFGTLAINQESAVQTLAFRAGLGRQTQVPPVFAGDPHFNWSIDGVIFAGYGVSLTYNSVAGDTNKLIRLKVKALPGDNGQISPQMIIDAVQAMIDIPPAPTLSVPVIAASSPAYNVLRVNTPTPAYSNIGATVTYEDYVDGVLIGSSTSLVRDYNILAGTYSINTIARDIANSLQQASNTITGVSVANPPVNQAPVISAPVVYNLGSTSVTLQYTASDDVGITAHQYSLGGVYFSDGVIENIGGGQYRLTINNLVAGTNYPNVTVKVLDAGGLSAIGTVSGGFTTSAAPTNVAPTFSLNPRIKANSTTYSGGNYTWIIEFGLNTQSPGVLADVNGDVITVSIFRNSTGTQPSEASYVAVTPTYNSTTGLWEISRTFTGGTFWEWVRLEDISHTGVNGTHAYVQFVTNASPSVPTGLSTTNKTKTGFRLNWNVSTDQESNNPITYKVYKGGTLHQSGVSTAYLDITGQGVGSTALWTVSAVDSLGNESAQSTGLSVTTLADVLPTISSVTATATDSTHITISGGYSDDENATGIDWFVSTNASLSGDLSSNYASAANKGTMSGADINTGASTFSKAVTLGTALIQGTNYYVYARATDASGTGTAWTKSSAFIIRTADFVGTSGTAPDSSLFTTTKAGTGVAQLDGSGRLAISTPSTVLSDVALVVVKNNVTKAAKTRKAKVQLSSALNGGLIDILSTMQSATSPVADTVANNATKYQIRTMFRDTAGTNTLDIIYYDTSNTQQRWDFTTHAWVPSGNTKYTVVLNTDYVIQLETTATQWRIILKSADESTTIDTTSWVNWSATRDTGNPMWAMMGDPNNDSAFGSLSYDWYDEY